MTPNPADSFEKILTVPLQELEFELRGVGHVPWADFLLNPRRLRGSDFLMRWSQGVWSEKRVIEAVNKTGAYIAIPYGPSGTAPDNDPRAFELYFERLEQAGLGQLKRPDLLIFRKQDEGWVEDVVNRLGGVGELPFTPGSNSSVIELVAKAVLAVECENSLWKARQMPDYGKELTPQRRLGGQLGLRKSAVLPTVILKDEDLPPLRRWQDENSLSIHIWHVFYDLAYGHSLEAGEELIRRGRIEPTVQIFQAPGGATTRKTLYKFYYHYAYPLAERQEEPRLIADHITDRNGHILPYVRFEGGSLTLTPEALRSLDNAASQREVN